MCVCLCVSVCVCVCVGVREEAGASAVEGDDSHLNHVTHDSLHCGLCSSHQPLSPLALSFSPSLPLCRRVLGSFLSLGLACPVLSCPVFSPLYSLYCSRSLVSVKMSICILLPPLSVSLSPLQSVYPRVVFSF